MKDTYKTAVEYWLSCANQHEYETNGFTVVIGELTDEQLMCCKMPTDWFLDFAPVMFRVVAPKDHAALRSTIAYLTELRCRQLQALAEDINKMENQRQRIQKWIKEHGTVKTA